MYLRGLKYGVRIYLSTQRSVSSTPLLCLSWHSLWWRVESACTLRRWQLSGTGQFPPIVNNFNLGISIRNVSKISVPLLLLCMHLPPQRLNFLGLCRLRRNSRLLKGGSPPLLCWLYPSPNITELDASDVGVRAVLSQRSGHDAHLHPCTFLSKKLAPAATQL